MKCEPFKLISMTRSMVGGKCGSLSRDGRSCLKSSEALPIMPATAIAISMAPTLANSMADLKTFICED